jgi:hypothetical protein
LAIKNGSAKGGWLPKKAVMRCFDYADNQLGLWKDKMLEKYQKLGVQSSTPLIQ